MTVISAYVGLFIGEKCPGEMSRHQLGHNITWTNAKGSNGLNK